MKITVLGKGNAGCLTALHYYHYGQFLPKPLEIELIYDSKIPTLTVGQATIPALPDFLWKSLGIDLYNNRDTIKSTFKSGILYENWGKINDKIFHGFPIGTYALHYDTQEIQNYIIKKGLFKVTVKDENVINYDDIDSDVIFDCRGWPKDKNNYDPLINPLNAVVCGNINKIDNDVKWTRAIATPDGWSFYIPLHNKISIGYMYNSNITSKENAIINFKKMYDVENIREEFPFNQYVAKNPIIDDRIVLNGNQLFFLEPLESTAVASYMEWNATTWNWLINKSISSQQASNYIKEYTKKVQNFILWHYCNGSKYDTKFWTYAKDLSNHINDRDFDNFLSYSKSTSFNKIRTTEYDLNNRKYAQWQPWSFKTWYDGVTKKL